ncbi:MAG: tRNA (adenosine(37)-N6)-threonylcarbamoyltransferase complex dimerization subunit type 1 TsaB [Betaproteobacteria bacterium]|nr:tRNA (adenosine(37)-N6)-threonylcarbamoyltransferase complex dimerization subunit type 1 TsaB [Betaproteobacteria bacterium]
MSAVLAVEAGGESFSAALQIGGEVRQFFAAAPHSEHALPLVQKLLAEAEMSLADCDVFAFGAGPGKFSGLRLACGIAQAFAFACGRPCAAVDSLAALAEANFGGMAARAEAALPAHRGHMYAARCRFDTRWKSSRPLLLVENNYTPGARSCNFCGLGFLRNPKLLAINPAAKLSATAPEPNAAAVAKIAAIMFAEGETRPPTECHPVYIRRKIAQTAAERAKKTK